MNLVKPISVVILGCTHLPFYTDNFKATFKRLKEFKTNDGQKPYDKLIDENIIFIDPSELTAVELYKFLADKRLLLEKYDKSVITVNEFYISVPNANLKEIKLTSDGNFTYDYKYGRAAGNFNVEYVKYVPMNNYNLKDYVQESIIKNMPAVWKNLLEFNWKSPRTESLPDIAPLKNTNSAY